MGVGASERHDDAVTLLEVVAQQGGNFSLALSDGGTLPVTTVNEGSGTLVARVPNLASLEALNAGALAIVDSVGALWTYEPTGALPTDGITIVTATGFGTGQWWRGPTLVAASMVLATSVWVDPVGGSDEASGTTALTPFKTFGEYIRRLGTDAPDMPFGQGVSVTLLNPQPAGTDPVRFFPRLSGGGQASLFGTKVTGTPFTAGAITAKSQTAVPSQPLTMASVPAGVVVASRLVNTSRGNSAAWVRSVVGGVATLSQPVNPIAAPGIPAPTENNAWATGDTIVVETLPTLNLEKWSPISSSQSAGGQASVGWVQDCDIADPNVGGGSYGHHCACNANVLYGCVLLPRINLSAETGRGQQAYLTDCYLLSTVQGVGGAGNTFGGVSVAAVSYSEGVYTVGGDYVTLGTLTVDAATLIINGYEARSRLNLFFAQGQLQGTNSLWGAPSVFLGPGGKCGLGPGVGGTFAAAVANGSGLTMGLGVAAIGSAYNSTTGVWTGNIALSAANVDTNGILCDPRTGAAFFSTGLWG